MRTSRRRLIIALAVLALATAACNRGGDDTIPEPGGDGSSTTTTAGASPGTVGGNGSTTTTEATTTTTTEPVVELTHEIRIQGEGVGGGSIIVVEVPGGMATDRALEDLFLDLVDQYHPVQRLDIVDALEAAELVLRDPDALTEDEQEILDAHHLLSYTDGTVTFEGPFSDLEGFVYGS